MSYLDTTMHRKMFMREMLDELSEHMDGKYDKMPDHWDGAEMKQYLIDVVTSQFSARVLTGKRLREYRNDVITRGL
jgi:hypothetical protein